MSVIFRDIYYFYNKSMKAVVKAKRPLLTKRHRKERLDFALAHQDWKVEDWETVV